MAGWDAYPIVKPKQANDPWAAYPIVQPSAPPAAPAAAAPAPQGFDDLPVPGNFTPNYTPPTLEDQVMGALGWTGTTAGIAAQEARKGVSNVVGLPVDLTNLIMGVAGVPVSDTPVGGSKSIDQLLTAGGIVPEIAPSDPAQAVVGRLAQEVGASMAPAGGILSNVARKSLPAIRNSPQLGDEILRFLGAEKAKINPGKYVADEATIAAGAGLGAGAVNELTGNRDQSNAAIDMAGSATGAAVTSLGSGFVKGVGNIASGLTGDPNFSADVVRDNVVDTLIQNSDIMGGKVNPANMKAPLDTTELVDAINRPSTAESVVPGYTASTADRSGDTGLALLEAARAKSAPGVYRARQDANTQAVEETIAGVRPTEQPGAYTEIAGAERQGRLALYEQNTAQAQRDFDNAIAGLNPTSPNETARGSDIRAALDDAQTAATALERSAWEAAATEDPVEIGGLAQRFAAVDDALTDVERAKYRPMEADIPAQRVARETEGAAADPVRGDLEAEDQAIYDAIMGGGEAAPAAPVAVSAREITSLRSALTTEIRKATSGLEPDENKARILQRYVAAIDQFIDATPELAGRFEEPRRISRDVNDRFNRAQTGIAQTLAQNGGMYQLDASAVPGKFVQPDSGRITDYRALMTEAGNDPRARNAVQDQLLADVRAQGLLENPEGLQRFLGERNIVLGDFPELRDQLERASRLRQRADTTAQIGQESRDALTVPGQSPMANYLQYGPENSAKAMRSVLSGKDPVRSADELLRFVNNDPQATEGLRAAFWQELDAKGRTKNAAAETNSGDMPYAPRRVMAFLDDPVVSQVAERLYRDNPEHLENIRAIFSALRPMNAGAKIGGSVNPSGTGLMRKGEPPVTLAEVGSKGYQVNSGRASMIYAATYLAGKWLRNFTGGQNSKAYETVLDKAMLDPELAALLLKENNPANRAALRNKAKAWLGNQASTLVNAMSAAEDDDEMTKAIGAENGGP